MGMEGYVAVDRAPHGAFQRKRGRPPLAVRMLQRIERMELELVKGLGPCWNWTGARNGWGYGVVRDDEGKLQLAHRVSLSLHLGRPLGPGMTANHRCHHKWCVRPAHLYEGTMSENAHDEWRRRRAQPDEAFV